MGILPGTDREGRRLTTLFPTRLGPQQAHLLAGDAQLRWNYYSLERALDDVYMQVNGQIILEDFKGLSLWSTMVLQSSLDQKAMKRNFELMKARRAKRHMHAFRIRCVCMVDLINHPPPAFNFPLQDHFPMRLKGIYLVNQPWYVSLLIAVVWPFMGSKMRGRVKTFGADLKALHALVDPAQLPPQFGGTLTEPGPGESWLDRMEKLDRERAAAATAASSSS